jgi:hypothetical protein
MNSEEMKRAVPSAVSHVRAGKADGDEESEEEEEKKYDVETNVRNTAHELGARNDLKGIPLNPFLQSHGDTTKKDPPTNPFSG